ncbi:hypothetical protein KR038_010660 [Drosophila bunnanda]|nr:hypothetical protein KR038_010660 [Drosophila bunnanda]
MALRSICGQSRYNSNFNNYILKCIFVGLLFLLEPTSGDWLMDCGNCHCKWNSGKKTADCRNLSLGGVPENLSPEVQVLDLSHNRILYLEEHAFSTNHLQNLHKLIVRNGTLKHINQLSFSQLQILIELDLSNNLLKDLLPNVFDALSKVRAILLNGNLLQTLRRDVFHNLKYLHKIEIMHNRLISIDSQAFVGVPLLSQIYLDNNELKILKTESFRSLNKLNTLSLVENPWNCTCDLQLFRDFVINMNLYTPPTACHYPLQLRGMLWIEDQPEAFACKPKIVYPGLGTSINTSKANVTLICRVLGTPNTVIAWDFNKQLYESHSRAAKSLRQQRIHIEILREQKTKDQQFGHDIFVSRLTILDAKKSDEGVYTCLAENPGGKDAAHINLMVQNTPQRSSLLGTDLFAIISLIALGFLSTSILLSMVTYFTYKRFKQLHNDGQHTHLPPPIGVSGQPQSSDGAGVGVSAVSVGVVQDRKIMLDPLNSSDAATVKNYILFKSTNGNVTELNMDARSNYAGVLLNSNYLEYLDNQVAGNRSSPPLSKDQELGATSKSEEGKLNAICSNTNNAPTLPSTGSTKIKKVLQEFQPDLLPSNESSILMAEKGDEDLLDRPGKQSMDNPRRKYNSNVQKYLREKYGSTRLTAVSKVRKDSGNIQETKETSNTSM